MWTLSRTFCSTQNVFLHGVNTHNSSRGVDVPYGKQFASCVVKRPKRCKVMTGHIAVVASSQHNVVVDGRAGTREDLGYFAVNVVALPRAVVSDCNCGVAGPPRRVEVTTVFPDNFARQVEHTNPVLLNS